jgi:DNA-binding transcriptional ArsR family regulator
VSRPKLKRGKKSVAERVRSALGHRIRIEALAALNERAYSKAELAALLGLSVPGVTHHIDKLANEGSIEVAKVEKKEDKNLEVTYYRAIEMPFHSDADIAAMSPEERQVLAGLILQASTAESMTSLWAGKLHSDPRVMLAWNWFNVDAQGQQEIADELAASWERIQTITTKSTSRRIKSGEPAISVIVTSLGYRRSRNSPNQPNSGKVGGF